MKKVEKKKDKRKYILIGISFLVVLILILIFTLQDQTSKIIFVGTETPPFEFYEEENLVGIDVEFLERIMPKLGIEYEIQLVDWDEAVKMIEEGRADILLGAAYSEERENFIAYTDEQRKFGKGLGPLPKETLWVEQNLFFYKIDSDLDLSSYTSIRNNGYKVGIVNGYGYFEKLFNEKLNFYVFSDSEKMMNALNSGEIDIAVLDNFEGNTLLREMGLQKEIIPLKRSLNLGANFLLFQKKYGSGKNMEIRNNFYNELIRLKEEENLHEELYQKYAGNTFSEIYGLA